MIKITTNELICLLFEIEQIEASLEYETGFNCYDYFLTTILMTRSEQVLECLNSQRDNQNDLIDHLIRFVSEYFNIQYQYDPKDERNKL